MRPADDSLARNHGVVVFGAGGFIGGAMARAFEEAGAGVTRLTSQHADLTSHEQTMRLRLAFPPGAVWVVAAARNPDHSGPVKTTNVRIVQNIAALAEHGPPVAMVLLSSIDVYGRTGLTLPLDEQSPRNPQSEYAESKCHAEDLLAECCKALDVSLLTLRLPGIYGPGDPHRGPVRSFIEAALRHESIRVQGDGAQQRDLLYVGDLAKMVRAWMAAHGTGLSNAVTGRSVSLNDMIEVVRDCAGRALPVDHDYGAPQFDITFARPRILRAFPSLQLTPIEQGIRETWRCERPQFEGGRDAS